MEKRLNRLWNTIVFKIARVSEPGLYFMLWAFTLGEVDLKDVSILYMDEMEAFLYMMYNTLWMSIMYPMALLWVTFLSPVYFFQICFYILD